MSVWPKASPNGRDNSASTSAAWSKSSCPPGAMAGHCEPAESRPARLRSLAFVLGQDKEPVLRRCSRPLRKQEVAVDHRGRDVHELPVRGPRVLTQHLE